MVHVEGCRILCQQNKLIIVPLDFSLIIHNDFGVILWCEPL